MQNLSSSLIFLVDPGLGLWRGNIGSFVQATNVITDVKPVDEFAVSVQKKAEGLCSDS